MTNKNAGMTRTVGAIQRRKFPIVSAMRFNTPPTHYSRPPPTRTLRELLRARPHQAPAHHPRSRAPHHSPPATSALSVLSTVRAIPRNPIRRPRNCSTATSLAAFRMVGAAPPACKHALASWRQGKRCRSGFSKVNCVELREVQAARGRHHAPRPSQGMGDRASSCRAPRDAPEPSRRHRRRGSARATARG